MTPAHWSSTRARRLLGVGALCAAVSLGGTGCVADNPFIACTAIGYSSTVEVTLEGTAAAEVDRIEVCGERGCLPGSRGETSGSTSELDPMSTRLDDAHWLVDFVVSVPEEATFAAFSADNALLGETTSELEWRRVGGTEACGGPHEAGPVVIEVG